MRLEWDVSGERIYQFGTDHCVLYPKNRNGTYAAGVAWNGITAVTESSDGGDSNTSWADNLPYNRRRSRAYFQATLEAFTYPDEFEECDGSIALTTGVLISQQEKRNFGLSWRTRVGNDTEGEDYGYQLHLVWDARATATEKQYSSVNDSPDSATFSWTIDSDGVACSGHDDTAELTIDTTICKRLDVVARLENILYGTASASPRLPSLGEVLELFRLESEELLDSSGENILDSGGAKVLATIAHF